MEIAGPKAPVVTIGAFNCHDVYDIDHPNANNTNPQPRAQYEQHLSKLATAIAGPLGTPDVLGLTEVEDSQVVNDLLSQPALKGAGYRYSIFPGNDAWGHSEALLYKPDKVTLANASSPNPAYPDTDGERQVDPTKLFATAPIVAHFETQGVADAKEGAFTVILNHLKSMVGGDQFADRRAAQGTFVGNLVDQETTKDPNAKVAVIGDLNTFAGQPMFQNLTTRPDGSTRLSDAMDQIPENDRYSYYYRQGHQYNLLDHVLVTPGFQQAEAGASIPHINSQKPNAKFGDPNAPDGSSDHDPVVASFGF